MSSSAADWDNQDDDLGEDVWANINSLYEDYEQKKQVFYVHMHTNVVNPPLILSYPPQAHTTQSLPRYNTAATCISADQPSSQQTTAASSSTSPPTSTNKATYGSCFSCGSSITSPGSRPSSIIISTTGSRLSAASSSCTCTPRHQHLWSCPWRYPLLKNPSIIIRKTTSKTAGYSRRHKCSSPRQSGTSRKGKSHAQETDS